MAEEKKGKYRIFCPNYGTMTCCNCTQADAIQTAVELQRGFGVKVELVEITENLGGVRIDFGTEGSDCHDSEKRLAPGG